MTDESAQRILDMAAQEGLPAEYDYSSDCVFVDIQYGHGYHEHTPVYSVREMSDLLGG